MISLIKQYWFSIVFGLALLFGVFVADWSYNNILEPSSPYMLVDKDVPSDYSPVGYEPIQITGKEPNKGTKVMVSCNVPSSYAPYVFYPQNWNNNILNPNTGQGQTVKYSLFGLLVVVVGLLTWRIIRIIRIRRNLGGTK